MTLDTAAAPARPGEGRRWRTNGVMPTRLVAWLIDLVIIFFWTLLLAGIIFVLGVVTFGLGWMLFAVLAPASGILYSMITVGGSRQATIGMRVMGLRVIRDDGGDVDWIVAGVHALLFYVAATTGLLWLADVACGLFNRESRLGHDLLTQVVVIWND